MSGSNQAFSGEGGLIGEDEAGRIGGEGHAGEEGRASASTPSLLSLTHPSSGSLQAYDIASGGGGVNMSVDRDEPYKGVPRSSFIPIAGPSTGTPTPMFTSGRDSSPSRYSPHVSAGSGGQYAHIGSSAAGMTGRQLQGEGGGHGGRDSPSKAAFDSFTSARRPLSRSSSPSLLPTRVVPPRSPSPLHSFRHNPDLSASTSSDVQLAHGPAPTLHRRPHKTEGLLDLSPATSLPYLSLPRSRSPEPLSLPGASSSSSRSMSPVSPGSMDFPQTAPIGSGSFGAHRDGGLKGLKKRPLPLDLTRGQGVGVDPELQVHMDEVASARSAKSSDSLSHEMNDLSLLRNKIRQNLHERPIGSTSDQSDSTASEPPLSSAIQHDLDPAHLISADELHNLHNSAEPHIILDCRSPIAYGQDHLDGSLNVSIPTLIVKRLRKGVGSRPTWATVGSYIAGQDGKSKWENLDRNARVVLLGETGRDEVARILRDVVGEMIPNGSAQILSGGWGNFHLPGSGRRVVSSSSIQTGQGGMLPPPRASRFGPVPDTAPIPAQPSVFVAPPTPPNVIAPRLANQLSMPSLRARRAQDQLNSGKKLPQLSLNVAPPLPAKAATLDSIGADKRAPKSPGMLTINTGVPNAAAPGPSPTSQGFPMTARKSSFGSHPLRSPMTKSFGRSLGAGSSTGPGTASGSKTPAPLTSLPQRTGHMAGGQHMIDPSDIPAGGAPGSARPAIAPFLVSTIIPNFLYLGPEILEQHEVDELQKLGVKRILNVAIECDDDSGLKLSEVFDRYHHIPMRDIVEEVHLSAGINNAMAFLDDARLRDSPTYVHCKAGKSRSVTIVLAYLIHSNAWTLRTAYSFVAERRPGISPNIGFVAELMQYAEVELGLRQHRAAQGDDQSTTSGARGTGKVKRTRARDSMPAAAPAWSSSLQEPQPARLSPAPEVTGTSGGHGAGMQIKGGEEARKVDEREIRREGAWVQHRRAPKDDRLRPSRRVSKAGLETIASVAVVRSPSPHPTSTFTSKPATPSTEGRAGWL